MAQPASKRLVTEAALTDPTTSAGAALNATYASAPGAAEAAAPLLSRLRANVDDAKILVLSDSTGYDSTGDRWVKRTAQALAANWPTHTVKYYLWGASSAAYDPAVTISTGTGTNTLHIYNAARSGESFEYWIANLATATAAGTPDLVLVNCGHNEGTTNTNYDQWRDMLIRLTETMRLRFPTSPVAVMSQNPRYDAGATPNIATHRARQARVAAQILGLGYIEVNQAFLDTGNPTAYLNSDLLHPNDAGSQLWADEVMRSLGYRGRGLGIRPIPPSSFATPAINILGTDGDFPAYASGAPTGWTLNSATGSKNTTQYESAQAYSVTLTGTGVGQPTMTKYLPTNLSKSDGGLWLTLAARVYVASGQPATAARVGINDGKSNQTSKGSSLLRDRWYWEIVSKKVDPTASYVQAVIYADSASGSTAEISVDRVVVVRGMLPRDDR